MNRIFMLLSLIALCAMPSPVAAADDDSVPYWASIDTDVANMRVGPGESYKIDWVYRRKHLPVKVIRREGPWRQIEDPDGTKGWMRDLLLSRQRAAVVIGDQLTEMRAEGNGSARTLWQIEPGVVGLLGECRDGWCGFDTDGHKGFVRESVVWGAGEP